MVTMLLQFLVFIIGVSLYDTNYDVSLALGGLFFLLIPTNIILFIIYIINKIKSKITNNRVRQLSILEKWEIDCESYKDPNYKVKTWEIQCYKCKYKKIEKGLHCEKLSKIPTDILLDKKSCEFRKIKLTIKPMEGVNEIKFGMTRDEIHSLWGETEGFYKGDQDILTDDYRFCHIYYDSNDLFEAIDIAAEYVDVYYENTILSSKYSDILRFFENIYDDIEEHGDGFISKKGSIGVYIENDEDIVDAILFGKKGYYLE